MTAKISNVKESKILHHYFHGMPQLGIAQKCGVNQATVSRCAAEFIKKAATTGMVKVAKEYGIMEEVNALRSLAIELKKNKATAGDAVSGLKMVKIFDKLGVTPEEHKTLAKAFSKVKEPEFVNSAINLIMLEEAAGKSYGDIVSEYQQLGDEITERQKVIAVLIDHQGIVENSLQELKLIREKKGGEFKEFEEKAEQKKAEIDADITQKLAEAGLTQEKIAKLEPVVEKIEELGISGDKLEAFIGEHQILEEYGITQEKFKIVAEALAQAGETDADGLAGKLAEHSSLEQAIEASKAGMAVIQPQVDDLNKGKTQLMATLDQLKVRKSQLQAEVGHLETLKKTLNETNDTMQAQRTHLEDYLEELKHSVAGLENRNTVLIDEVGQKEKKITEMDDKLKTADALDEEIKEKAEELQQLDTRIAAAGQKYHLFEAFLGLVAGRTDVEIKEFLKSADVLISEVKTGNYDPTFLANYIIGQLVGSAFDLLVCRSCGAEYVMVKRGQKYSPAGGSKAVGIPEWCPDCMVYHNTGVKAHLAETLKGVIVSGKPVLIKKPGETSHKEKSQSGNQAGQ